MSKKQYFYIFYDILKDYTSGVAGTIAPNKKEAIDKIIKQYNDDQKHNKEYAREYKKLTNNAKYIDLTTKLLNEKNVNKIKKYDEQIKKLYDNLPNKSNNHTGTTSITTSMQLRRELTKCKNVVKHELTDDFAFYIGGGS